MSNNETVIKEDKNELLKKLRNQIPILINIPLTRYDELIKAEEQLNVLKNYILSHNSIYLEKEHLKILVERKNEK